MSKAYYNENDPFAAAWLRELIKDDLIAQGDVDERSIKEVRPNDLAGYTQCHFFAGIGVWSYSLRKAGWPDGRPCWTGSCPCQPFSNAGKRGGFKDDRHLWPDFFRLISVCKPIAIIGEQVASKDGLAWLDIVQTDLEGADYSFGAVDTCAAGFGAPHIRQRLYFVAHPGSLSSTRRGKLRNLEQKTIVDKRASQERKWLWNTVNDSGTNGELAQPGSERQQGERLCVQSRETRLNNIKIGRGSEVDKLADSQCDTRDTGRTAIQSTKGFGTKKAGTCFESGRRGMLHIDRAVGNNNSGLEGRGLSGTNSIGGGPDEQPSRTPGFVNGFWKDAQWIPCIDGKARPAPVEPLLFPLAAGIANRVGLLRGAGNALCSPQTQGFIEAYLEVERELGGESIDD